MKTLVLTGLLALVSTALGQAATPAPTPTWAVCDAARDPRNYKEDDLWAVIINRGEGGWLFGESSYWGYSDPAPVAPAFRRFADTLRARGTELVMVQVPPKSSTEIARLGNDAPKNADPVYLGDTYSRFVEMLNASGIYAPDLRRLYRAQGKDAPPFFFERDHHWTPAGAALAAKAVAGHLKAGKALNDVATVEFVLKEKTATNTQSLGGRVAELCQQTVPLQEYVSVDSESKAEVGLLDEAEPGVVLVGTSNSFRNNEDSFAAHLRHDLQRDVVNAGVSGGGPWAAIEKYLASDAYRQSPPRVLIWEMNVDDRFFRERLSQLTATVKGVCEAPVQKLSAVLPGASSLKASLNSGDYFAVKVSDPALKTVPVKLSTADGQTRTVQLTHQALGTDSTTFFGEVDALATGLSVDLPESAGALDVTVCKG